MNYLWLVIICVISTSANSSNDTLFKNGFEIMVLKLNDTGVIWAGNFPFGNNIECTSSIVPPQDCQQGRDATDNDDTDGHAGFSYTKLNINGDELSVNAGFWDCVKDNVTGLVWEVKQVSGLHDKNDQFTWGGLTSIGLNHPGSQGVYNDDWNDLVNGSNDEQLCGNSNWRVPTIMELTTLVNLAVTNPAIDIDYFPNTQADGYWSATPYANNSSKAWYFHFENGLGADGSRNFSSYVRLVRYDY